MATWTELLSLPAPGCGVVITRGPEDVRELLLDLPFHPNASAVREIHLLLDEGRTLKIRLASPMASGASGPITPGAGVQRDTVQPWRVTPALGDAGAAPTPLVIDPPPGTWPALLDGAAWPPKVETVTDKPLIILGDK
jgi:hypothetical protein